ncbi:hypothetical protein HPB50_009949 [Hyalomma asiaticum]|uniref:Uncharacterized protein n=1 Tax=Hyalomma asiaticum TaxID=266040 RepID=A0ACB7THT9_HYAAI|nr:hypothetical protein HPB50_009949 [Hyalomma asiaticum]
MIPSLVELFRILAACVDMQPFWKALTAAFESLYTSSHRLFRRASAMATCSATYGFVVRTVAQFVVEPLWSTTTAVNFLPPRYAAASTKLALVPPFPSRFSRAVALARRRPSLCTG